MGTTQLERIRTAPGADIELPADFGRLRELAYNLWWSWSRPARELFYHVQPDHWRRYHNPVESLINVTPQRWEVLQRDDGFRALYHAVLEEYDRYQAGGAQAWFRQAHPEPPGGPVAYFSTEYGWHECLQSYSGGLGVLSGDHCKAASDLGLPFIGIGLAYHRGYFRQTIDFDGQQQHFYPEIDLSRLPLRTVLDERGAEVRVFVDFPGRAVAVRLWKADVGRVPVLLLDSNVPENEPADRRITAILYVQGREMRLCQEMLLGVGGVRALRALNVEPCAWHINEGHSSLLSLERLREAVTGRGLPFAEALREVAGDAVFTTHTPVAAGNESFDVGLIRKYFESWARECGVGVEELLDLGRAHPDRDEHLFNMTALAIRSTSRANGVSRLHGKVAEDMWRHLDGPGGAGRPIGHVTNGVHVATWLGAEILDLLAQHLGRDFMLHLLDPGFADAVRRIPDREVWDCHSAQKLRLLRFFREQVEDQAARYGASPDELRTLDGLFETRALTIGFARRFATYKRADLMFRDAERLRAIVTSPERPVQILFAGKAHPVDRPGQELIRRICNISHSKEFAGRVVFLENYDMRVGRCMVQGVDLWLNNPRRPLEASGTSGMKAAANGALNFSVLDGWWAEGHDPAHGWAIGQGQQHDDDGHQDHEDAQSLLITLANEIVPCFYDVDDSGLPREWIARMKTAIGTLIPRFAASRMVREYTDRYYIPAARREPAG